MVIVQAGDHTIVTQHFFKIEQIQKGQRWASSDNFVVIVDKVDLERDVIFYHAESRNYVHESDAFKFQTRYCLILD